jgi:hypothetical protein
MATIAETFAAAVERHQTDRLGEAEQMYRQILAVEPEHAGAWHFLGVVAYQKGNLEGALQCARRSLEIEPDQANVHNNLGLVLHDLGLFDEAAECFRRALELQPRYATAHYNLGRALREQGKLDETPACYRRALELTPDDLDVRLARSTLHLLVGDFDRGWSEYEWRWRIGISGADQFRKPEWRGEPLSGKTVLLHSEQGLGDTLQFIRYAPLVKRLGAVVLAGCQRPLKNLLARSPGIDRLIGDGHELPPFDFYAPLLTLPRTFRTTLDTIPNCVPYVFADPTLIAEWHEKLADVRGYRVGINWHGRVGQLESRKRDVPLSCFARLAELPGVRLISLQKGNRAELAGQARSAIVEFRDIDEAHGAFMDTAAIMMNLDLVITSDTSVAHLAGALGVPVWVALPFVPDWRWLLDRSDSPWYPTMRLFRQKSLGDWAGVFEDIRKELQHVVGRSTGISPTASGMSGKPG